MNPFHTREAAMRRSLWIATVSALTVAACDQATEPAGNSGGGLALEILPAAGATRALESGRIQLQGPTPRTVTATPGTDVTISDLQPGDYTVSLEGFVGNEVEQLGRTATTVVAGQTKKVDVTLSSFKPVLNPVVLTPDGLSYVVSFPPVAVADSYRIETDHDGTFASPRVLIVTPATGTLSIDVFGPLFVRARAYDPFKAVGAPSGVRAVTLSRVGSLATLDGVVTSAGGFAATVAFMGDADMSPGLTLRQLYGMDLSGLPPGPAVTSAVLRLFQASATSGAYEGHGNVIVDHVDFGNAITAESFDQGTLQADIGILSTNETIEHKTIDVTAQVQADRAAGRQVSEFRLLFEIASDDDGANDIVQFGDEEQSCAFMPPCEDNDRPELRLILE